MNASLNPPSAGAAPSVVLCDHCGLRVPPALRDPRAEKQFCCGGCRVAFETICASGLAEYYRVRRELGSASTPEITERVVAKNTSYAAFDDAKFLARHASCTDSGAASIELRLEGVHCAACVWLIERLPRMAPGVLDARLNLCSATARVVWDPAQVSLSAIAGRLAGLGYAPHPARGKHSRDSRTQADRKQLLRLGVAGACAGNSMLIALALYTGEANGIEPRFLELFRWLSMGVGVLALAWPGATFFRGALAALRTGSTNLDLPIALALAVGGVAGIWNVFTGRGEIYFDSLAVLVFLLLVGRFLQSRQQRWAEDAVGLLLSITPVSCRVIRDGNASDCAVDSLVGDELLEVRSGELFSADATVEEGESCIDLSLLTGESAPQPIGIGSQVYAGAKNVGGTVRVRVNALGEQTRAGKLMRLVEEGARVKAPLVELADRMAGRFVVVVAAIALANFACWLSAGPLGPAIESTVALLVVACPCALGLATPLTMAVAIGRAARDSVLIKDAAALERLGRVGLQKPGLLLLDKTGTLTLGRPRVIAWRGPEWPKNWLAALESESIHPIGRALVEAYASDEVTCLRRAERLDGGVVGWCVAEDNSGWLAAGSVQFFQRLGVPLDADLLAACSEGESVGATPVLVGFDGHSSEADGMQCCRAVAAIWLRDEPLEGAAAAIAELQRRGWSAEIVSGDRPGPVEVVAAAAGIPIERAAACTSPEGKLARVLAAAHGSDYPVPTVVMVGDGVNDAAALAAADVGIAVHGGTEASLAAADIYIARPGVGAIVDVIELSRCTMQIARGNLAVSLCYNVLAVSLAAAGWITPLVAAILMPISSATVLAIAFSGFAWRSVPGRASSNELTGAAPCP